MATLTQKQLDELEVLNCITKRVGFYVKHFPERPLITWVGSNARPGEVYTYSQFDVNSRRRAAYLLSEGIAPGEHVVLAYTPGVEFYLTFWACLLSGIVPVPVNPPFNDGDVEKFRKTVVDSGAVAVLTNQFYWRLFEMKLQKERVAALGRRVASVFWASESKGAASGFRCLKQYRWFCTTGRGNEAGSLELTPRGLDDAAFIMYSSGSTSSPKGALTSFRNMHHQFELVAEALDARDFPVNCWWAPHFHDFGLLSGFLNTLHQGGHAVVTSPMDFIARPTIWLDLIDLYSATHTFGPDFGYQLLIKHTSKEDRVASNWNLSSLRVAMSAAEKIRETTLVEFSEAFSACHFRPSVFCPAYGLAEHSVGVSINGAGRPFEVLELLRDPLEEGRVVRALGQSGLGQRTLRLVGCGTTWAQTDVRIVELDEEGAAVGEVGEDRVGEVWVSSESKTLGYHRMPELTEEVFQAVLPGEGGGSRRYLRTGDYGFVDSESGELYICGRKKDMVIIGGKNHYSEDLELSVANGAATYLRPGRIAAFSIDEASGRTEELVLVAEVKEPQLIQPQAAFKAVIDAIASQHKISVSQIALVERGSIPKTTSGKLRRFEVRKEFVESSLRIVPGGLWRRSAEGTGLGLESKDRGEVERQAAEFAKETLPIAVYGDSLGSQVAALTLSEAGLDVVHYRCSIQAAGSVQSFLTFSKEVCPNLTRLVQMLGQTPLLAADGGGDGVGFFGPTGKPFSLGSAVLEEVAVFEREIGSYFDRPEADSLPVRDLVQALGLSKAFVSSYLVGLISPFDPGQTIRTYLGFPTRLVAWIWLTTQKHVNHEVPQLYHIDRRELEAALSERFVEAGGRQSVMTQLKMVRSESGSVILRGRDVEGRQRSERFQCLMIGGSPEQAAALLESHVNPTHCSILKELETTTQKALVDEGGQSLPEGTEHWKSVSIFVDPSAFSGLTLDDSVTTVLPRRSPEGKVLSYMVYNASRIVGWPGSTKQIEYSYVPLSGKTQRLRYALGLSQGEDGVYFCGDWTAGMSTSEDGIVQAITLANLYLPVEQQLEVLPSAVPVPPVFEKAKSAAYGRGPHSLFPDLVGELVALFNSLRPERESVRPTDSLPALLCSEALVATVLGEIESWSDGWELLPSELYAAETIEDLASYINEKQRTFELDDWEDVEVRLAPSVSVEQPFASLETIYPVSFSQQSILISHFLGGQRSNEWNISVAFWLLGGYSAQRVQAAIQEIAQRHASLRSTFHPLADGGFGQRLAKELPADFFVRTDVNDESEAFIEAQSAFDTPMDITQRVLRVHLLEVSPQRAALVLVVHHGAFDGASLSVLFREFQFFYRFLDPSSSGKDDELPRPELQFVDFAHWQHRRHKQRQYEKNLLFWENHLKLPLPAFSRKGSHEGWGHPDARTQSVELSFEKELVDSIRLMGRRATRTSLNLMVLTAYAELLGWWCDANHVAIRLPVAARPPGTEDMIGCLAEAMVVRLEVGGGGTFVEAVARNHSILYEAFLHPAPFYLISQRLGLDGEQLRDLNKVVLNWDQTSVYTQLETDLLGDLKIEPFVLDSSESTVLTGVFSMLNLHLDTEGGLAGRWYLTPSLVNAEEGQVLADLFRTLFEEALRTQGQFVCAALFDRLFQQFQQEPIHIGPFYSRDVFGGME